MTPEQLKSTRANLGLTQSRISDILGINIRTYRGYELGEADIPKTIELSMMWLATRP